MLLIIPAIFYFEDWIICHFKGEFCERWLLQYEWTFLNINKEIPNFLAIYNFSTSKIKNLRNKLGTF